jgi:hypothetical protein
MALKPFSGDLDPIKQAPRLKPYDGPLDGEEKNPLLSSAKAGVGHGIKSVGTVLKDVGLPQLGGKIGGFGQEIVEANPPQITSLGDIVDKPFTAIQEGVGQAVASLPPTLASAGAGAALGASIGGPAGAVIGGGIGAFAPNLVAEYGEIREKQTETGIDDKGQALLGAVGAAGLETVADATIAGRFLPKAVREALPSISPLPAGAGVLPRLGQAGKAGLMGAGTEAATEAAQTYIERAAGGQDITSPEAHKEAGLGAALGAFGGGTIRGGIELVSPTREQAQAQPQPQPQAPKAEQVQPPQPDFTDFEITPDGEIIPRSQAGQPPQPSGIAGLLPAPPNFEIYPDGTIVPRGTPVEEIEPGLPIEDINLDRFPMPVENIDIGLPDYPAYLEGYGVEFIPDQTIGGTPPPLGPLARAANRAPMMPGVPYTESQQGGIVRGGLTAGELAPITPVQPTGEPADERQERQRQAPRQDAEILGQPATDGPVSADQPVAEPASGPVAEAGRGASPFEPTHKLSNGTPVRPNLDDSGKPIKGEWVDADGDIWEDDQAQPIERPAQAETPTVIDQAAHEAATSPENDLPQPTEAQKEAGNYKKGHVTLHGLDITIENPRGSERSGTDKSGKPWRVEMAHHYGYIKRTEGADGDQVDVFIGPNPDSDKVFVVNQVDPSTKRFDEHKVMLGFDNAAAARKGYLANYAKGWKGLGSIDPMSVETFKKELAKGVFRKPVKTQREDIADTETRIPEEAEPAPPQEQDTDDELAKLDKLYVTAREMVGDRADEKIRSILGSATTKAIGWLEFEGDQYRISLEHLFRTGQVNVNIAGDDKKVSRVTRVSDDADLGHAMGALLAAVNEGATIRIDPPQQEKPETEKPRAESKPKETTGSAEDDARLESFRKQIKERKRRGLGDQLASAASQRAYELLEAKAKADPSKWNVGNGVGHRVVGQISRGFRIVEIDPETKLAMIRSVADTGLTTSGGNADRIEDSWVHIASLVRDRKYDAPAAQPELDEATEQPTEAAQSEPEKPTAPRAKSPRMTLAEKLAKRLEDGETISSKTLFADADAAFGGTQAEGTYSPKDAYDAMEAAVNLYIMLNEPAKAHGAVSAVSAADQAERLHELTKRLPTQTRRDEEMDEFQQFSTPPALAYVANWSANIKPTDTMMEPSAGTGDLAVWARNADANLILNELSKRRAELLRELFPKARVFTENAEQLNNVLPADARPTVVVMNPPFSATAGRKKGERKTSHGAQHIEQALKRLQPGGRLVAIVGEGMAMDRPAFRAWWDKIKKEYNVRANIGISGKTYAKYGTTFDNQILVIDKTGPTTGDVITGNVERPSELPGILEDIRNDRVDTQAADELSQTREPEAAEPGGRREAEPGIAEPVRAERDQPDAVGAGQREARDTERGRTPGEVAEPGATEPEGGLAVSGRPGEDGRRGDIGGRTAADEDAGRGRGVSPGSAAQRDDGDERSATDVIQPSESSPAPKVVDDGVTFDVVAETPKAETPFTESVFEQYTPQKVKVKGAKPHPGKLVQSAAMAAVEPPAPNYTPKLPKEVIEQGLLSDAQLEAVVYAGQAHTEFLPSGVRRGFFIGDGTGVGKGREISGIILDNQRQGRDKAVWISFNEGLINDAKRDFKGIGGDEGQIFWHGKTKAADPITAKKGILFTTYSTLRGGEKKQASETDQKKGKTRVQQIAEWLGKDFDGVIVFDEAHKMGNAVQVKGKRGTSKPSQQALAGIELQAELPKARVVYVSATGATEVMNLAYASRLGLWGEGTPFANVADFISDVSEGGVAAMELVSRDMKALGMYLARSLSYDGVTYDRLEHELTPLQHDVYNELAKAWQTVLHNVNLALEETGQGQNADAKSAAMSRFWGSHQRFFNQVITSLMTPSVIDDIRKQIMAGNAVVIQLTNTNEAEQERQAARAAATETPLEEMDFTPRQALMEYIRTGFPVQQFEEYEDEDGNTRTRPVTDASGNPVFNQDMVARRDNLLRTLEQIRVPDNPIDEIINAFGSDMVAEVTGRGRRFVRERDDKGSWTLAEQKRGPQAARADATAFQGDRKKILIFSDAGGTGYSFHADNTAVNQRRRIHYILQPGWRADGAVQGFGRTHRTNQASAPHYVLPTTNLKAQKRFVSSIARRLDQLGALTRGQRDASSQGLFTAADNLESEYASEALFNFFDDLYNGKTPLDPMATLEAMGLEGIVDKKTGGLNSSKMPTVPKFLNRLLSLTQEQQDQVFDEFMQRLDDVVRYAIDQGTYDTGLETLTAQSIKKASEEVVHTDERTGAKTRLVELDVTNPVRYVTFKEAQKAQESMLGEFKGWFRNEKTGQVFGLMDQGKRLVGGDKEEERGIMLTLRGRRYINKVSRILSGKDYKKIGGTYKEVKTFSKLEEPEAKALWEEQRKAAPKTETIRYGMLVGAILPIWNRVTGTPKIFRTQTDDGERFLGRLLTKKDAEKTMRNLGIGSDAAKLSTAEQYEAIEKGARAILANEWEIAPAMVSGERRLEIIPGRAYLTRAEQELLTRQGVFVERINWQERFFIPRGEKGPEVFARVVADKPVVELAGRDQREAQEDDDEFEERFSRTRPAESIPEKGVSVREARSVIAEIQKSLPGTAPVSIRVVESQSEIEGAPTDSLVEAVIRMRGPRAELTVVAGNIGTADDLVKVVREELVGHFGLRNLMGSEFNSLMDDIKAAARVNPNVAKMWRELSGRDPKTGETVNRNADYFGDPDAVIADELISKLAREKSRLPILKRIYQKLMAWLRKVGLVRGPMNVWELEGLVARSEAALRRSNVFDITKPATTRYHRAWHGSPHEFDEFSLQKIGTGEGAQAYGYGLYFASSKAVAKWYRDKLSKYEVLTPNALEALTKHAEKNEEAANLLVFYNDYKEDNPDISLRDVYYEYIDTLDNMIDTTPIKEDFEKAGILSRAKGRLYEVELAPKEDDYLDWDKPLSEQSEKVQAILTRIKPKGMSDKTTGEELYIKLSEQLGKQDQAQFTAGGFPHMDGWRRDDLASQALHQLGIPGIRYKDATARGTDKESYNYVIFDDRLVQVVNRFSAVSLAGADESRQTVAARLWQRLGTNSPYFKRWFKDSKIRKAGKPMVVYHGTNTDIAAFDKGVLGDATRHSTAGLGFFFATDLDAAATYAEKATRARGGRETVGGYYLSIQNPYVVTSELLDRRMGNLSAAEFRAKLERAGHDGIYVKDAGYIVAFEPEQVKSIENVGTFDPMEAEVRYSRRTPDTGEPIDPVDPNAAPRFEQRLRDITVSDVKTLGGDLLERFRPIGLQALGRRQIVDVYGEAVPALHEYDRLAQAYAADSNKTQQDADKVAQDWGKLERKTADKLADIMHQSTLNGVDVSQSEYAPKWTDEAVSQDFNEELAAALKEKRRLQTLIKSVPGGAKAELWERLEAVSKTVERMSKPWSKKAFTKKRQAEEAARKAAYNRLRPEFTALPKEAQAIYTKARDMYSAHWKAVEQALVDRIERSEAVESEKRRIIDQLRLRFRKQLPDIYFPLHRTGDYVIVVKNADGMNEAVMFAETPRQAKKLRAELMRRYAGTDKQVMPIGKKKEKSAQDMVSGRFVSEVLGLIGEAGQGAKMDALREQVVQLYLESLPDLSWAKHELHRKGTPGYSRDARRAFAAHMFHGAAHLSRIRYADRLESSLDRMQGQVDSRRYEEDFDAVRAQDVVNEMKKRHDIAMNPPNTPLANLLTSAGFVWYMGLSPASAIVNLSQTPLVAFPVLGGHFGFRKAARSLTTASADITRALAGGGWFKDETAILDRLKTVLAPDEYAVIQKGIEDGHISVTLAHELAGVSQGAEQNPAARSIMRGASWMFHTAEMFNRMSTVLAGYRMGRNAIDSTAGYDKSAYGTAIKLNYDSHFDYAADNRPRAMQGPVARVVLLFKQYAQNMIYLLARNGMEGLAAANDFLRGRPISEKRKAAAKVFGGILAMHAMAAGAFGLPFVGTLLAALSWLGSDDDEPWDAEVALRNYLADTIGARPAEALVHGLPRLARDAVPADISRRVGLDNLLLPDVQEGLEGDKWYQAAATAALGPVAGVGLNIAKGAQTMAEGETWRGVEEMLPKALKDILKTGRFAREGVIDKTGLSILDDTTFGEELAQVAGFSPARVLEAFESRSAVYGADRRIEARRRQLMAQWSKARMDRDISSVQEAMQAIREFNKKNPERRITMDSLSRSFKNRQIRIREAESGIYLPRTRRGMLEEGRFFEDF